MKRVEGGHWRMGSSALLLLVVDEDGRGCCLGRLKFAIVRLRRVGRGRVGIEGMCLWRKLSNVLTMFFRFGNVKSDICSNSKHRFVETEGRDYCYV